MRENGFHAAEAGGNDRQLDTLERPVLEEPPAHCRCIGASMVPAAADSGSSISTSEPLASNPNVGSVGVSEVSQPSS